MSLGDRGELLVEERDMELGIFLREGFDDLPGFTWTLIICHVHISLVHGPIPHV